MLFVVALCRGSTWRPWPGSSQSLLAVTAPDRRRDSPCFTDEDVRAQQWSVHGQGETTRSWRDQNLNLQPDSPPPFPPASPESRHIHKDSLPGSVCVTMARTLYVFIKPLSNSKKNQLAFRKVGKHSISILNQIKFRPSPETQRHGLFPE